MAYVAPTDPGPIESWSRDGIYRASPSDGAPLEASADADASPLSESNLLEIDPEIFEEMNPTPSARYERLYLMDHLGPEDADDPPESDDLASAWLRRATQGTSPREQKLVSAFDKDPQDQQTVIDLSASTLEEGEIVRPSEDSPESARRA